MNQHNRKKYELAGINKIIYTQELIGMIAKEFSGRPVAFEAIHALRSEQTSVNLDEISVDERMIKNYTFVKELGYENYHLLLLGIYKTEKEEFLFNPLGDTIMEKGDILLVIGEKGFINEFNIAVHKKRSA